eukprot:3625897-Prymnesium_polylepis.1
MATRGVFGRSKSWYDVWPRRLLRRHFGGPRGRCNASERRALATCRVSDEVPVWVRLLRRPVGLMSPTSGTMLLTRRGFSSSSIVSLLRT